MNEVTLKFPLNNDGSLMNNDGSLSTYELVRWAACGEYILAPAEIREFINEIIAEAMEHR